MVVPMRWEGRSSSFLKCHVKSCCGTRARRPETHGGPLALRVTMACSGFPVVSLEGLARAHVGIVGCGTLVRGGKGITL